MPALGDFFQRVYVVHMPQQHARRRLITTELERLGVPTDKVVFDCAFPPLHAEGFPSKGAHGCFLSHLKVLKQAMDDGLRNVWVLEDDALFSQRLRASQAQLVRTIGTMPWGLCYFGYAPRARISSPEGLVRLAPDVPLETTHCYAVKGERLAALVAFLEAILAGTAHVGRMHVDGALNHFRRDNPAMGCLISQPSLCNQRGGMSNIAGPSLWDRLPLARTPLAYARRLRDELWRHRVRGASPAIVTSFPAPRAFETALPEAADTQTTGEAFL